MASRERRGRFVPLVLGLEVILIQRPILSQRDWLAPCSSFFGTHKRQYRTKKIKLPTNKTVRMMPSGEDNEWLNPYAECPRVARATKNTPSRKEVGAGGGVTSQNNGNIKKTSLALLDELGLLVAAFLSVFRRKRCLYICSVRLRFARTNYLYGWRLQATQIFGYGAHVVPAREMRER